MKSPRSRWAALMVAVVAFGVLSAAESNAQSPSKPAASKEAAPPAMFQEGFLLLADDIDCEVKDGEMLFMEARGSVDLKATQLTVLGGKLLYDGKTKVMKVWRDAKEQCTVIREGTTTRCNEFVYNTETGEGQVIGDPQVEMKGSESDVQISGNNIQIARNEGDGTTSGTTTISISSGKGRRASIGSVGAGQPAPVLGSTPSPTPRATPVITPVTQPQRTPQRTPAPVPRATPRPTPRPR